MALSFYLYFIGLMIPQILSNLLVGSIPLCPFSASLKAKRHYASEMKSFHPHSMLTLLQEMTLDPRTLLVSVLCMHVCVLSCFSRVQLLVTPWTAACPAPLSMGLFQTRIMEWIAMPSSGGSSRLGDRTCVSYVHLRLLRPPASLTSTCTAGGFCVLLPMYLWSRVILSALR